MKSKYRKPTANDQQVLDGVKVRLIRRSEEHRWPVLLVARASSRRLVTRPPP